MKQIKVYVYDVELAKDDKLELIKTLRQWLKLGEVEMFSLRRF